MRIPFPRSTAGMLLSIATLLFIAIGLIVIPLAGIQDDEALFAAQLFTGGLPPYSLAIFRHHLPLMVFPYTGALKTYVYWPVFRLFRPNPYSLRVPMLLAGAATILIVYAFAKRIAGARAALLASVLLATDPTFLFSDTFDWGPVALQHLLLVAGCLLIVRGSLRGGCFVFGLALWDKAVFVWALAGLVAGILVAYLPEVRRVLADKRRVAGAALAFAIGASPLIVYNLKSGSETVRSTAHFAVEHLPLKFEEMHRALNGGGLFRFLAAEEWESDPKPAGSPGARVATAIHDVAGNHRSTPFPFAVLLAMLAAPLWWRTAYKKPALFSIAFMLTTFAAMAITRDAGEAIHHTVLLWPMPQLLVGAAVAAIGWRWAPVAAGAVLVASNLLVMNQYIFQLERFGADGGFSDAIYPLSAQLPLAPGDHVYLSDWGAMQTLTLLHRGRLALMPVSAPFQTDEPDPVGKQVIANVLADPHGLFVGHVREREVFKGAGERLDAAARAAGYQRESEGIIGDSNGHPVFEMFRFHGENVAK